MNGFASEDLLTKTIPASSITGSQALTKVDDTNVTLTLGGTPANALLRSVSLTLGWTGTLADGRIASAATWNAKESALTISTGLTRATNTITNDVLTGKTGGQTWIGGTAVGDGIIYKGTTGNGTTTVAAHTFTVGNNGATVAAAIYNSGNFNVGNASDTGARIVRIGQDTAFVDIGSQPTSTSNAAIYFNTASPSLSTFVLMGNGTTNNFNAATTLGLRIANSARYTLTTSAHVLAVAAANTVLTQFSFTGAGAAAQTASTEAIAVNWNLSQTNNHSTGALTLNRDYLIQPRTHSYSGSSTGTDMATFAIGGPPVAGTNATHTNAHGILVQAGAVGSGTTNGFGITANAPSGATNNYPGQFIGGTTLFAATVTGYASIRLPHGTAPSAPVDGDVWTTTAGIYVRINGATVGPLT